MADKLDWLGKHLVLIRYLSVADAVIKEGYKIPPELEELYTRIAGTEDMVFRLAEMGNYKAACELLAYICHHRAGVWWAYRSVLSLLEELKENPAVERDISEIGANFEVTVPDWAKFEMPELDPSVDAALKEAMAGANAEFKALEAMLDPEVHAFVKEAVEVAFQEFRQVHGIHPMDLLKKAGQHINDDPFAIHPASPAYVEADKLKAQIQSVRQETIDTIKSVLPPKVPAHEKKKRDGALNAVYRWVAAPDAENSQKCLDMGNECPDTPAGLLSLSAFWSYGDLLPLGEQIVTTPPGLAANGLSQVLLMCALHKGGTRKPKERYQEYFRLGVAVLSGADNWEASLATGKAPHEEASVPAAPSGSGRPQPAQPSQAMPPKPAVPAGASAEQKEQPAGETGPIYRRWKPGEGSSGGTV